VVCGSRGGGPTSDNLRDPRPLIDHQCVHHVSKWAIIEEESGQLIGRLWAAVPAWRPRHRARPLHCPLALGRDHATEAGGACHAWAVADRPDWLVAIVDPASAASARAPEKIGMRPGRPTV
jgi:hypothetical protein